MSTKEAAQFLGKPVSWMYNNVVKLGIPRYSIGNHWRFKLSELSAYVERTRSC